MTVDIESNKVEGASYALKIFQATLNILSHLLIGLVVGICLIFSLRNGLPLGATPQHIVLCVIGVSGILIETIFASNLAKKSRLVLKSVSI